jgi:hypothetical protein
MTRWLARALLLACLIALGIWVWTVLFPNPEKIIRRRLAKLEQLASVSAKESPFKQAVISKRLGTFFSSDIEVAVNAEDGEVYTFHGRPEFMQAVTLARSYVNGLELQLIDPQVNVAPDRQSAAVELGVLAKVGAQKDVDFRALRLTFQKIEGDWVITRAETIKLPR